MPPEEQALFLSLMAENLRRGKVLAYVSMITEAVFAVADVIAEYVRIHQSFHYSAYLMMYLLMLLVSGVYVFAIKRFGDVQSRELASVRRFHAVMIAYITFIMVWGSVVTLMDQALYGQLIVFIINALTCSVFYSMSARNFVLPYALSLAVLLIGLPIMQHSPNVLIGHYVNLCFFSVVTWIASRMLYRYHCSDFTHKAMLVQANKNLQDTVLEYDRLNEKLTEANNQLKEASLLDDLTGIPNRRSFRVFIDRMLSDASADRCFSVLMIDIDFFKRYNDHYGHAQGDEALIAVASAIERSVDYDVRQVVRWGGEEFLCAIFHPPGEDILKLAEKVRQGVQAIRFMHEYSDVSELLSVSIGGATRIIRQRDDISLCIEKADRAMYRAKAAGRNRCCIDSGDSQLPV